MMTKKTGPRGHGGASSSPRLTSGLRVAGLIGETPGAHR
jgi:hypothetical protein